MAAKRGRVRPLFIVVGAVAAMSAAAGVRRWLDLVEVRGSSMTPALLAGDWLLVERWTYARRAPRRNEVVLAVDPRDHRRELVKRVGEVAAEGVRIVGDNPLASTDSGTFGVLPLAALRWRAVARCWPPRRIGPIFGADEPLAG
ncbi:MAG: S26 family signal peptidase [Chloroflexota bacterium]